MPYFTRQVFPNGSLMVVAMVGISAPRRIALQAEAMPVPNAVRIEAMIDTGASCTCIDPAILDQLGLTATGSTTVNTPTTGDSPHVVETYDVGLTIYAATEQSPLIHQTMPVIKSQLKPQGIDGLIGRDVLRSCFLTYDGQNGLFTLAY